MIYIVGPRTSRKEKKNHKQNFPRAWNGISAGRKSLGKFRTDAV